MLGVKVNNSSVNGNSYTVQNLLYCFQIAIVLFVVKASLSQQFSHYSASQQFSHFSQFSSSGQQFGGQQHGGPKSFGPNFGPGPMGPQPNGKPFTPPQGFGPGFNHHMGPNPQFRHPPPPQNVIPIQNFGPNAQQRPVQSFRPDPNFEPSQTHFVPLVKPNQYEQQFVPPPFCSAVKIVNQTSDGWHGKLNLAAEKDINGVQIDVMFDEFVPIFSVSFFLCFQLNF